MILDTNLEYISGTEGDGSERKAKGDLLCGREQGGNLREKPPGNHPERKIHISSSRGKYKVYSADGNGVGRSPKTCAHEIHSENWNPWIRLCRNEITGRLHRSEPTRQKNVG